MKLEVGRKVWAKSRRNAGEGVGKGSSWWEEIQHVPDTTKLTAVFEPVLPKAGFREPIRLRKRERAPEPGARREMPLMNAFPAPCIEERNWVWKGTRVKQRLLRGTRGWHFLTGEQAGHRITW